ncbi:MAG: CoA-binding protein [Bacteroidetes bacterium]|nr:CoA-binding protein [Bacteroidota bacterium]
MSSLKTVVIGASENTERYSNRAVRMLKKHGHEVVAVGLREGEIEGVKIDAGKPAAENVHTVTLYVGPANQAAWLDYIASLKPQRLILNPGTENEHITQWAKQQGIEPVEACTLVMLSVGTY